jgi:nicotinamidase-related amidase
MGKGLLVIDIQNDYFPGGAFPLWNPEAALENLERAVAKAARQGVPVILVQHLAEPVQGAAPFFTRGTAGAELHPRIRAAAPGAPVVVKAFADGFHQTALDATLQGLGITELLVAGMMTQNCVTHTAISKAAEKYAVTVLPDCCTTVSEILHLFAIKALSTRVALAPSGEALA